MFMRVWGKCTYQLTVCLNHWKSGESSQVLYVRFVHTPIDAVNSRLSSENDTLKKDISDLEKRLHYLETTHEKSRENIEQILKGTGA